MSEALQKLTLFYYIVITFCSSKDEVFSDSKSAYISFHAFKETLRLVQDTLWKKVVEETLRIIQVILRFIDVEETLEDYKNILMFMDVEENLRIIQATLKVMGVQENFEDYTGYIEGHGCRGEL
jgi:hypothetical protein